MFNEKDSITLPGVAGAGRMAQEQATASAGLVVEDLIQGRGACMLAPQPRAGGVSVGKGSKIRRHRTCRGLDGKAQAIFSCVQLRKFYLMNNHRAHNYVTFRLSRFISLSLTRHHS